MYEKILLQKLLITSKYATYCMLLQSMALTFAFANNGGAQTKRLNEIYISVHLEGLSLEEALVEIGKKSDFMFVYNDHKVKKHEEAGIQSGNKALYEILLKLSKDHGLRFKRVDKNIFVNSINRHDRPVEDVIKIDLRENIDISGRVTDENGQGLPGASILEKGTNNGTITDSEGNYKLSVPEDATLVISFIGYLSQEVSVGGKTIINLQMLPDLTQLQEVVVIGYGVQKKENLTGAVGQVSGDVLENRAIQNAGQGLQGMIANLTVVTNPGSPGKIGQGSAYQIRGVGNINGGSAPLVLIDGVQGDLNLINPNDIESISVLKDASSAAIYGARATFGVILVTTKKGSKGKMRVSLNSSVSSNSQTLFPKVVNSLKYAEVMNDAAANSGWNNIFGPDQLERIKQFIENPGSIPTTVPEPGDPSLWSYSLGNDNINYFEVYYKDRMLSQKHDFAVSGGSQKTDYRFSVGYLSQDGIFAFGQDNFKRYNVLGNVNTELNEVLNFSFQTIYNRGVTDEPYEYGPLVGDYFHTAYTRQPHWPLYDPNGNPLWTSQIQFFEGSRRNTRNDELKLLGVLEFEPIEGWKITTRYSYGKLIEDGVAHQAMLQAHDVDGIPYDIQPNNSVTKSNSSRDFESLELFSSYDKQIKGHGFTILAGGQRENYYFSGINGFTPNLVSDAIPSLNTGTGRRDTWDDIDEWTNIGFFGRLNYNFKGRYLFEANARYDGTSKFPTDKQWGFFPSISAGWNIANENFFEVKHINALKLRASYGSLGNQQISNYLFYPIVPIRTNLRYLINGDRPNYTGAPGLVSNDLTWATVKTLDLGIDISALNNRLNLSFDWFERETFDMIGPAEALPSVLGVAAPVTNNADMVTKGFELTIGWKDMIGENFEHDVQFNLSDNFSVVTKYNNPTKRIWGFYEGKELGEIWGYTTAGIIQTDEQLASMADQQTFIFGGNWNKGDIEYTDLNGDGTISQGDNTLEDPGDLTVIGNSSPRYAFGLRYSCRWRGFDFNMFWQGIMKRDFWLGDIPYFGITGSWTQQVYETTTDYWTPENTDAFFPRPYAHRETTKNQITQTRFLQNAAYTRLKNIQVGYSLPNKILEPVNLQRVRFYLSGENLLTFSPIDENFDPERLHGNFGNGKSYPLFRTITMGLNIEF